ncbi:CP family cyanate transporter-like MFS transporter [Alkalihalobacillus xiaoxiensis]|uniref:CP family cyanate transporter-like MFS transporter n=1 Tax=Shouchella xiaoxiensis TaxID=766895 RepID=A0ABS2SY72_9BACI|nr:MFS transporter [Shouchella xiaoxiensis]MBM7839715.1 CP family cyanate transporter-like MFS transporter [Shouchella xiaoxiensis]
MRTFYLLLALALASLNLRPAITSVSPLLESIQQSLGISGTTASLLTTLPVLCMGVFAPLATTISKRIGLEKAIFFSLLLITFATAVRGVLGTTGAAFFLIVTAFLAGVGIGIAGPLLSGFIKQYFPHKPGFVSIYSASLVIGAGVATGLAVPFYEAAGNSWQISLAVWAVFGIAAVLLWIKLAKKRQTEIINRSAALPLRNKRALLITLFFGLMATVFYTTTAWAAPIVMNMGYSAAMAGTMITIFQVIQIPVSLTLPNVVARKGGLTIALISCSLLELAGIFLLITDVHPLPAMILLGVGAGGLFPLALMLPILETETADEASALSAMNQGGGYVFAALGPFLVGILYDTFNSFKPALIVLAFLVVCMIAVQWTLGRTQSSAVREKETL